MSHIRSRFLTYRGGSVTMALSFWAGGHEYLSRPWRPHSEEGAMQKRPFTTLKKSIWWRLLCSSSLRCPFVAKCTASDGKIHNSISFFFLLGFVHYLFHALFVWGTWNKTSSWNYHRPTWDTKEKLLQALWIMPSRRWTSAGCGIREKVKFPRCRPKRPSVKPSAAYASVGSVPRLHWSHFLKSRTL